MATNSEVPLSLTHKMWLDSMEHVISHARTPMEKSLAEMLSEVIEVSSSHRKTQRYLDERALRALDGLPLL